MQEQAESVRRLDRRLAVARMVSIVAAVSIAAVSFAGHGDARAQKLLRRDQAGNIDPTSATSFDCGRATTRVEHEICTHEAIAREDGTIGELYQLLLGRSTTAERATLRRTQRMWLAQRDKCNDLNCVDAAQEKRVHQLEADMGRQGSKLNARLARVGQCEDTRIDYIGARLEQYEGEEPDGTSVGFTDGLDQVSYDREAVVLRSRPGDPARICLASIPKHCPRGDDRGRFYKVVNLRTGGRWSLPDSQHSCGGA